MIILPLCSPISAYVASFAPAATTSATASLFKSDTSSSTPAFNKFFAIGLPMIPSPINPTFIFIHPFSFSLHMIVYFHNIVYTCSFPFGSVKYVVLFCFWLHFTTYRYTGQDVIFLSLISPVLRLYFCLFLTYTSLFFRYFLNIIDNFFHPCFPFHLTDFSPYCMIFIVKMHEFC